MKSNTPFNEAEVITHQDSKLQFMSVEHKTVIANYASNAN